MKIAVQRVELRKTDCHREGHRLHDDRQKDSTRLITRARPRSSPRASTARKVVSQVTYVDGKKTSTKVATGTDVTAKPVADKVVVKVGTKARPACRHRPGGQRRQHLGCGHQHSPTPPCGTGSPSASPVAAGTSTPATATTAAAVQPPTWLAVGGDDFARGADLAIACRADHRRQPLYARAGLQPWGCALGRLINDLRGTTSDAGSTPRVGPAPCVVVRVSACPTTTK
jgi:hypothetical protein